MRENLKLTVNGYGDSLTPRDFHITEHLSSTFTVMVTAKIGDKAVKLETILGGPASFQLAMLRSSGTPRAPGLRKRKWHGVVSHVAQLQPEPTGETPYLVVIVPALWLTTQSSTHRVYQHISVPDIVDKVLAPYQIKAERSFKETHPKHEYVVQHGETDFAFVSRLLEEAGISYLFQFGDSESKLVLSDQPETGPARGGEPIHYVHKPNPESQEDYVTGVQLSYRVAPSKVTLVDYNFRNPALRHESKAEAASANEKEFEQYFYAPDAFLIEQDGGGGGKQDDRGVARHKLDEGKKRAQRVLTAIRCQRRGIGFSTNAMDLSPGAIFSIHGHPHTDLGEGTKLLITDFALSGSETGDWSFSGRAEMCDDKHKPEQLTPRPSVTGVQSAIVVGPKAEEIETDEYGRVRVQFQWDREGKGVSEDQPSSAWMRVSQPWAGKGWGVIDIPRIGQEVLVRCFEGDPDAPVVTGRVYNKIQPVPHPLPKHQQKTVWKSDSSPHVDNHYNELYFDDRKDFELVYLQAQRDRQELVRRHETERAGENLAAVVGNCTSAIVATRDAALVGKEYSVQLIRPPTIADMKIVATDDKAIPPQKKPIVHPLPTKIDMVDGKIMATSQRAVVELDGDEIVFEAAGEISLHAGGNVIIEGGSNIKINC